MYEMHRIGTVKQIGILRGRVLRDIAYSRPTV